MARTNGPKRNPGTHFEQIPVAAVKKALEEVQKPATEAITPVMDHASKKKPAATR